jgi:hypothetical protein
MRDAIFEAGEATENMLYRVADQTILVEAHGDWATRTIEQMFAGWYLTRQREAQRRHSPAIVIRSNVPPPQIHLSWPRFEVAGGGSCFTDGKSSYIDIEGSAVGYDDFNSKVDVWANEPLDLYSPTLTRIVTYALSAALRRRRLFELHSGAVVDPESGRGVLIIGPSGSGKSTLTVQLASAGWPFLTDDVLLLSKDEKVKAWPLRRSFAITSQTFAASSFLQRQARLSHLGERDAEKNLDKKLFAPHAIFSSGFREVCTPEVIFFTELSGAKESTFSQLSSAETMSRLIRMSPWSCYDQVTAGPHLEALSGLVKQATGYALLAGEDLLEPSLAAGLIARYTRN